MSPGMSKPGATRGREPRQGQRLRQAPGYSAVINAVATAGPQLVVHLTCLAGTGPFRVGGLKLQLLVRTTVPAGCSTLTTALVKLTSVIVSVH